MNTEASEFVMAICAALTLFGGVAATCYYFVRRLNRIEFQVELMWDTVIHGAIVEGIKEKVMTRNSPLRITPEYVEYFQPLAKELQEFNAQTGKLLSNRDMFKEIQVRFGHRLLESICLPNKLQYRSCILAAIAVARGQPELDISSLLLPEAVLALHSPLN